VISFLGEELSPGWHENAPRNRNAAETRWSCGPDQHVLGPVHDVDEALVLDAGHAAGVEPAVAKRLGCRFGLAPGRLGRRCRACARSRRRCSWSISRSGQAVPVGGRHRAEALVDPADQVGARRGVAAAHRPDGRGIPAAKVRVGEHWHDEHLTHCSELGVGLRDGPLMRSADPSTTQGARAPGPG
jgi:hypothetical protein